MTISVRPGMRHLLASAAGISFILSAIVPMPADEPSCADGIESPAVRKIYYHYGEDVGGAVTEHRFEKTGRYLVRVERSNARGEKATPEGSQQPTSQISLCYHLCNDTSECHSPVCLRHKSSRSVH